MTGKTIAVNFNFLPIVATPVIVKIIIGDGAQSAETVGYTPVQVILYFTASGIKINHRCNSVRHLFTPDEIGCDVVSGTTVSPMVVIAKKLRI